jgi:hypothetical protein
MTLRLPCSCATDETPMGFNLSPWKNLFGREVMSRECDEKQNESNPMAALLAPAAEQIWLKVGLRIPGPTAHPPTRSLETKLEIKIFRVRLLGWDMKAR